MNIKSIKVLVLATLTVALQSHAYSSDITVAIVSPINQSVADDKLDVRVSVSSEFEIISMVAQIGGRSQNLAYNNGAWVGLANLEGLERGPQTLTARATDVYGNTAQSQRTVIYDRKPRLTFTSPLDLTAANPTIRFTANCDDDNPAGCTLQLAATRYLTSAYEILHSTTGNVVDTSVSLAQYAGSLVVVRMEAIDSAGQTTSEEALVYVESSGRLSEVESVDGEIWRFQSDRILFIKSKEDRSVLKIHHRSTDQDTVVIDQAGIYPLYGELSPKGAIFVADQLYEFRDNELIARGAMYSKYSLRVAGNFSVYSKGARFQGKTLFRRNLLTGAEVKISDYASYWINDVAANGDVVFSDSHGGGVLSRYRDGVTKQIATGLDPRTDGNNIVYKKGVTSNSGSAKDAIARNGPTGETILSLRSRYSVQVDIDYQMSAGWTAYRKQGSSGQLQVWICSPDGVESQLTFFNDDSELESMGLNGQVMIKKQGDRYLCTPGHSPVKLEVNSGKALWQEGQWWLILGRSLFRLNTADGPVITQPSMNASRVLKFEASTPTGLQLIIQATTNLHHWESIATNTVSGGEIQYWDLAAPRLGRRFYRLMEP